jgi:hypothetical protein
MRYLRVRFKVWQVMAIAALVAVLLAPIIWRRDFCLRMAARQAHEESVARAQAQRAKTVVEKLNALSAALHHAHLRSRYEGVASRPWEPLPYDPFSTPSYGETGR